PPNSPIVSCGIVFPCSDIFSIDLRAASDAFRIASATSFALPNPTPTLPSWSPATIRALKLKRRPPLTTFAQRLMNTTEKVVFINRCAKVVKGGRRFSFSALIVAGDHDGKVGVGFGKANEVAEAIRKASEAARKSMEKVSLHENTIPHEVIGEFDGARVLLRPASPGTGIIAGGGVRAVTEAAGIRDVLAKSLGSSNHANVVKATIAALKSLRRKDEIFKVRGIKGGGDGKAAAQVT